MSLALRATIQRERQKCLHEDVIRLCGPDSSAAALAEDLHGLACELAKDLSVGGTTKKDRACAACGVACDGSCSVHDTNGDERDLCQLCGGEKGPNLEQLGAMIAERDGRSEVGK